MKITAITANLFFMALNKRKYISFLKACKNPEIEQEKILLSTVKKNRDSEFGKLHSFSKIKSINDFQRYVPISSYDGYNSFISRIMAGNRNVLCSEDIKYFALSSGSSSASKFIPYTASLKQEFSNSVNPWLYDLLRNFRGLKYGTQFWIITPVSSKLKVPESKIPIGFEDDSDYFGKTGKNLIRSVMCLPDEINKISGNSNYFYLLAYFLLKDKNLRLISVWNPGLLISILKFIKENFKQLCTDIATGTIRLPNDEISEDRKIADSFVSKKTKRGKFLASLTEFKPAAVNAIWPKLEVISCWTDSWASVFIDEIKNLLPGIQIQGKGLLATEGVVSIPLKKLKYPLLSIKSHFYEFLNLADKKVYLAHELKQNEKYEVILTAGGGFYRYQLNDIVEVKGYYKNTPLIKFISKSDIISDICGEKLNENFIGDIFKIISKKFLTKKGFMFLAPQKNKDSFNYTLYLEKGIIKSNIGIQTLLKALDTELMNNFHYNHCRKMNQLSFPKLKILTGTGVSKYLGLKSGCKISSTEKINYLETSLLNPDDFEGLIY